MNNDFITRICSISNHPIKNFDEPFRIKYLKGLWVCLSKFKDKKKQIESLYKAWCLSIIDREPDSSWLKEPELKNISCTLGIQRKGFRFFTMRKEFFFDCFYFLSIVSKGDCEQMYEWLRKEHCGIFTRPLLKKVYAFFKDGMNEDIIPKELLEHKRMCEGFQSSREKRILVVANMSAGKSTLINALIGYRLNRTKTTVCTSKLCYIYNKPVEDGVLSYNNKKREYSYTMDTASVTSDSADKISLKFSSTLNNKKICLIDTPGVNNIENPEHRRMTEDAIKANNYDAIIYVSNCQYFGTTDERRFLEFLKKHSKRPIIFVLNQLDRFNPEEDSVIKMLNEYTEELKKIGFTNPIVLPVSAYMALLVKLDKAKSLLSKRELYKINEYKELVRDDFFNLDKLTKTLGCELIYKTGIIAIENQIQSI